MTSWVRFPELARGSSSVVERGLAKSEARVQFPLTALYVSSWFELINLLGLDRM